MTNPNDPAFAHEGHRYIVDKELSRVLPKEVAEKIAAIDHFHQGLTKREYFAVMAMQGLLSNSSIMVDMDKDAISADSVIYADALIQELSKEKS